MLIWPESICRPPNLPSSYCCVTCDPSSCSGVNCREFLCVCRECAGGSGAQGEADPEAESPAGGQRWQGGKQSAGKWQLFSAFYCNHVYSQLLLNFCFCALFGIRNVICDGWEAGSVTALNPGKHSKLSVCVCVGMLLEREGDEAGSAGWRFIATRSSLYVCRNSSSSHLNAYSVFIWIGKIQKGALKYSRCRARSAAQAVFLWSFWFFSCLDATVD